MNVHADINECQMDNGGCEQMCTNIEGSFICSCNTGYVVVEANELSCAGKNNTSVHPLFY